MSKTTAKSKETKKEPARLTKKRVLAKGSKNIKGQKKDFTDGYKPDELLEHVKTIKNRNTQFEMVKTTGLYPYPDSVIPKYLACCPRMPVVFHAMRLAGGGVKPPPSTGGGVKPPPSTEVLDVPFENFLPAEFVKMEFSEYYIMQAPTKAMNQKFWKFIKDDSMKIIVCMCTDEQMSATDDSKCYTYFPTEPEQAMEVEQKKGKFTIKCKSKEGLSMGAIKYDMELSDSETIVELNGDDPLAKDGKHHFTIYHMNTWSGVRPENGNMMEQVENVASFLRTINLAEFEVIRLNLCTFIPPVVLQSFDGVGRGAIAWVILMLLKDMERRDCFDIPDLIKKIMKLRPGSISNYFHYAFTIAVGFQLAKSFDWQKDDSSPALDEIVAKFPERKLNENGNLPIPDPTTIEVKTINPSPK